MEDAQETHDDIASALLSGLLLLCLLAGMVLRSNARLSSYVHETGLFILIGAATGGLVRVCGSLEALQSVVRFDKNVFFIALLPPIIFESGFNMDKEAFWRNLPVILMLAIPGTLVTAVIFSLIIWAGMLGGWSPAGELSGHAAAAYGSAYAATDPVTILAIFSTCKNAPRDLAAIVAGESLFNDAVAIVLYERVDHLFIGRNNNQQASSIVKNALFYLPVNFCIVFVGSVCAGAIAGALGSLLYKHYWRKEDEEEDFVGHSILQVCLLNVYVYVIYAAAASLGASGIVVLLTTSIVLAVYGKHNMAPSTIRSATMFARILAYCAESFVFAYLGLAIFSFRAEYDAWLIFLTLVASAIARVIIVPLCFGVFTVFIQKKRPQIKEMALLVGSGLRGAMAFALVSRVGGMRHPPYHAAPYIMTSTLASSLINVLIAGATLRPILSWIEDKTEEIPSQTMINTTDEKENCGKKEEEGRFIRFLYNIHHRYLLPFFTDKKKTENPPQHHILLENTD